MRLLDSNPRHLLDPSPAPQASLVFGSLLDGPPTVLGSRIVLLEPPTEVRRRTIVVFGYPATIAARRFPQA